MAQRRKNTNVVFMWSIGDCDITLENGKCVPMMSIRKNISDDLWKMHENMMHPDMPRDILCLPWLKSIPPFIFGGYLDRLLRDRLERKSCDVQRLLDDSGGSWETTCYWLTARYFGGKLNAFAFEMLAKMTPMRCLAKVKDDPFRVDALLLGQAGLLEDDFRDEYPQQLKTEYAQQRSAYGLSPGGYLWRSPLRPASFPTLRISQLACLIHRSSHLFSHLMKADSIEQLRTLFSVSSFDYFTTHYYFDRPSSLRSKVAGQDFADVLIINVWVPLLFHYGAKHDDSSYEMRARICCGSCRPNTTGVYGYGAVTIAPTMRLKVSR